jgi:aminoglycoside 3-N-acetyltransferase
MFTYADLMNNLNNSTINKNGTLLVHSSMKAIGEVEGGADTVLNVLIDYMKEGLLIFPTHTWEDWNLVDDIYNPLTEKSCVGLLPNLFMKKEGVVRSLHPTHSVAALGNRAEDYIKRDQEVYTPCPPTGCFGGLYEEDAQILFLGTSLNKNTYIHSLEEQMDIPDRINPNERLIKIVQENGFVKEIKFHSHFSSLGDPSKNYAKLLQPLLRLGYAQPLLFGQAQCYVVDVQPMADFVLARLKENPALFCDNLEMKMLNIRKSTQEDISKMMELYVQARAFMRESGNPNQWHEGYPSQELLLRDISRGESYVCVEDETIVGTFMLSIGDDPTYAIIEEGQWLNEEQYGVIHRITTQKGTKGVATFCLKWCEQQISNIRIDTHTDNIPMHRLLIKNGYSRCGIIYLENGDSRVAYHKVV